MNNAKTALDLVLQKRAEIGTPPSTFHDKTHPATVPTGTSTSLQQQYQQQPPHNNRGGIGGGGFHTDGFHAQQQQPLLQQYYPQQYYPQQFMQPQQPQQQQQSMPSAMFTPFAFPSHINAQGQFNQTQQLQHQLPLPTSGVMYPSMSQQQQQQQQQYTLSAYPHQSSSYMHQQSPSQYVIPSYITSHHPQYQQQESSHMLQPPQQTSSSSSSSLSLLPSPAEKQTYYCEPCDKEFNTLKSYEAHKQTHEKCKHPECQFSGSKKVVVAHYHAVHGLFSGSGYKDIEVEGRKFRVLLGSNEKEIEQWRAERRKKFPTTANIARKESVREEITKAGGIVPKQRNGNVKRVKREQNQPNEKKTENEGQENDKLQQQQRPNEEMDEEKKSSSPVSISTSPKNSQVKRRPCRYYAQGKCGKGDDCSHSHDFEVKVCKFYVQYGRCNRSKNGGCSFFHDRNAYEEYKKNNPLKGGSRGVKEQIVCGSISGLKKIVGAKEPSLMSKLLQDQIDIEENKILQSFRFLLQHYNFEQEKQDIEDV